VPTLRRPLILLVVLLVLPGCSTGEGGPSGSGSSRPSASGDTSPPIAASSTSSTRPGSRDAGGLTYQANGAVHVLFPGADDIEVAPELSQDKQHPDWSPDGTTLAFDSNFLTLWTALPDGPARQLFNCVDPCANVFDAAWSPDGQQVVFVRIVGDGVHTGAAQLVGRPPANGTEQVIHQDAAGDVWLYEPRWSPDGARLLVEWDQFASTLLDEETVLRQELHIIEVDTGDGSVVPGTRGASAHDWSPLENLIVFERRGNLVTAHPDGTQRRALTDFDTSLESAIQPTFTPDGAGVVFTWVHGVPGSGTETTTAAIIKLSDHTVTDVGGSGGATHPRLQPATT